MLGFLAYCLGSSWGKRQQNICVHVCVVPALQMICSGCWAGVLQLELSADDSRTHQNNILSLSPREMSTKEPGPLETQRDKGKKRLLKGRTGNERGETELTKHGGNEQARVGTKRMNLNTKGEVSTTVLAFRTCIGLWHSFHIPRQMLSSTDIFAVYHTSSIPATAHHAEGLCGAEVSTETRATNVIPVPSSQISLWVLRCQITGRFILLAPLEKLWMHPPLSVALPFKKLLGTLYLWDSLMSVEYAKTLARSYKGTRGHEPS